MQRIAFYVTATCWGVFYTYWLVSAFATKRTAVRESFPGSFIYRIPVVVAGIVLVYAARMPKPMSAVIFPSTTPICVLVVAFSTTGLVTCLWARITLGRNWSSVVMVKVDHELVQTGPYRFVRHPIYSGIILMFAAIVLLVGRAAGILAFGLFVFSFVLKLRREERMMLKQFPTSYPEYVKKTKLLVPFIV
jgi:protein-S-isoprenylcysteine O-methyltransferase Ste14